VEVRQLMEDRRRLMEDRRQLIAQARQISNMDKKPRRMFQYWGKLVGCAWKFVRWPILANHSIIIP
jgi:hypothetical protein